MSKPEIHTFGIAKYVYASAYDALAAENGEYFSRLEVLKDECKSLNDERDELKAGRASFFDVHAKMQDRLSDAEADNAKLLDARRGMSTYKGLPEPEPYGEMTKDERNDYAKAKADAVKKAREAQEGTE